MGLQQIIDQIFNIFSTTRRIVKSSRLLKKSEEKKKPKTHWSNSCPTVAIDEIDEKTPHLVHLVKPQRINLNMNDDNNFDESAASKVETGWTSSKDDGYFEYIQSLDRLILHFSQMEERILKKLEHVMKFREELLRSRQKVVSKKQKHAVHHRQQQWPKRKRFPIVVFGNDTDGNKLPRPNRWFKRRVPINWVSSEPSHIDRCM